MRRDTFLKSLAALAAAGALPLPAPIQGLMPAAARVMTTVAHHV